MRKLITFFVNRPVWGNAFIAIVIIFGVFALSTTKKSFFPELDPNTIIVSVFYPGASPNEMEEGVTIKIEQAVKGIASIDEINSTSSENFTSVKIKAFQDTDMDQLLSDVDNAINSINSFPEGAEKPITWDLILKKNGTETVVLDHTDITKYSYDSIYNGVGNGSVVSEFTLIINELRTGDIVEGDYKYETMDCEKLLRIFLF